jgi:5-formyltetrahydrofolate cyclo-ligase
MDFRRLVVATNIEAAAVSEAMEEEPRRLKKELRRAALARRDALDERWRIEASLGMVEAAGDIPVGPGEIVSGFWPMRSEVDIRPLMFALREKGARLCLPAILDKTTMIFRELVRGAPMVDMGFGTMGPGEQADVLDPSLMLVPLAAFDRRGHRIGYGAGYYDRAIARLQAAARPPRLVGIAFDCQEVQLVPDEWHDVIIPEILTESGLRRFGPQAS